MSPDSHGVHRSDVGTGLGFDPWPEAALHVEWFPAAARQAARRGDILVMVDVLSLSTTLSIAAERHFTSLVYSPAEIADMGGIEAAAAALEARPLSKRRMVPPGELSLSPGSLLEADPGQRVLFTSLNGAAVVAAAGGSPRIIVASLRNCDAAADVLAQSLADGLATRATIVASGEHWSSVAVTEPGPRPAIEDWVGAGLLAGRLAVRGYQLSAEAKAAAAAADAGLIADCISARELRAAGFADDVELALQLDVSKAVPVCAGADPGRREFTRWRA
jgi:2-phosphosulfolactate phosphatase